MRILRAVLSSKKKPTIKIENNNFNVVKIEKDFEVPLTQSKPKVVVKSSRDVNLIKPAVKKPVKVRPVALNNSDTAASVKAEVIKSEVAAKANNAKTKTDAVKGNNAKTNTDIAKGNNSKTNTDAQPETDAKPEITIKRISKRVEAKANITTKSEVIPDPVKLSRTTVKQQPLPSETRPRRSSRLDSPTKTDLKVIKVNPSKMENLRKSKRSVAKNDRNLLKIAADESFDEEAIDEMETIEISENDEIDEIDEVSDCEREIKSKKKKNSKKYTSSKGKKPLTKKKDASRWERIKKVLESGGTVEALPGRIDEFDWIKRTVTGLLESSLGGCLYISGVPGTGKTATTHRTLDALSLAALKGECCDFDFVEINGMRLSDPGQAYSILAKTIFKGQKRVPSSGALSLQKLESHFKVQQKSKTPGRPCVVLLDELDLLLRKKQSLLYHFFEWPNWTNSQLIVITIANTMDLPERFLSNRISSRLGLTRYNFKPYDHAALANIIEHQLKDYVQYLGKDAIQLCARKVSAVSGDARRAVNLAKRAVDYFRSCTQEELVARMTGKIVEKVAEGSEITSVNLRLMDIILKDALMANPVEVISQLAKHQRILLLSIVLARKRCEEESSLKGETKIIGSSKSNTVLTINRVLDQHFQLCRTHQYHPLPSLQELHCLLESLESLRLLRCVKFRESGPEAVVQLLVHEEDIRKGLGDDQALKKYMRE